MHRSKKTNIAVLVLITIVGLLLGSTFSVVLDKVLDQFTSESNVLRVFTWYYPIQIGYPEPVKIDLRAILFHFGFQLKINIMSFLGLWISRRFYRSYL